MMTPELSRRIAVLMETPTIIGLKRAGEDRAFLSRAEEARTFEALALSDQDIILQAEADIAYGRRWDYRAELEQGDE